MSNITNNDIALTAAYLDSNVIFLLKRLDDTRGETSFSRRGNTINVFVLPRFHKGLQVDNHISLDSTLHDVTLIKMMLFQTESIVNYVSEKDPNFASWISGILISFIKEAADRLMGIRCNSLGNGKLTSGLEMGKNQ